MIEYISAGFMFVGIFFIFVGSFGVFRLPDLFCRAHALTKAMTLGITLVFLGALIHLGFDAVAIKLLVAMVFLYITIPVSGHILGLIAFRKNIPRWKHRDVDT